MVYIVIRFCVMLNVMSNMLLKIIGQIFTSLTTQIVDFLLLACIRRYIYQTCRSSIHLEFHVDSMYL